MDDRFMHAANLAWTEVDDSLVPRFSQSSVFHKAAFFTKQRFSQRSIVGYIAFETSDLTLDCIAVTQLHRSNPIASQ